MPSGTIVFDQTGSILSADGAALRVIADLCHWNCDLTESGIRRALENAPNSTEAGNPELHERAMRGMNERQLFPDARGNVSWNSFHLTDPSGEAILLLLGKETDAENDAPPNAGDDLIKELKTASPAMQSTVRRFLSEVIENNEHERKRIAREIHDDLGQTLALIRADIERMRSADRRTANPQAEDLKRLDALTDQAIESLRRSITGLYPPVLRELGLRAAIKWQLRTFEKAARIRIYARLQHTDALPSTISFTIFRILQESLSNVLRHSSATEVRVTLRKSPRNRITLTVSDNGRGLKTARKSRASGSGISGMRDRAFALGGTLELKPRTPTGTVVRLQLALQPDDNVNSSPADSV